MFTFDALGFVQVTLLLFLLLGLGAAASLNAADEPSAALKPLEPEATPAKT